MKLFHLAVQWLLPILRHVTENHLRACNVAPSRPLTEGPQRISGSDLSQCVPQARPAAIRGQANVNDFGPTSNQRWTNHIKPSRVPAGTICQLLTSVASSIFSVVILSGPFVIDRPSSQYRLCLKCTPVAASWIYIVI